MICVRFLIYHRTPLFCVGILHNAGSEERLHRKEAFFPHRGMFLATKNLLKHYFSAQWSWLDLLSPCSGSQHFVEIKNLLTALCETTGTQACGFKIVISCTYHMQ
jgi:hypothetical protein